MKLALAVVITGMVALGQESSLCVAPPEAIDDLRYALAFEREFRTEWVRGAAPPPGDAWRVKVAYTWWKMGLYFFLPGSKTVFSYNPDSVTRIQGSQISLIHCGDDGFLKCLDAMFPSNQSRSGQDGPRAQVCSVSITIPTWRPSADSALKRSIIEKIKERLPIELAGNLKRALMSDFNLNDPTVLIYAEVEIDGAVQRLWLPASMNWRRVSMPVRLVRLGESLMYQEAEGQLKVLLRHSIPLAP